MKSIPRVDRLVDVGGDRLHFRVYRGLSQRSSSNRATERMPRKPEENRAWREAHEHLAASVKDGKLLAAERSAHLVPQDQPEIIVAAVEELVRVARAQHEAEMSPDHQRECWLVGEAGNR